MNVTELARTFVIYIGRSSKDAVSEDGMRTTTPGPTRTPVVSSSASPRFRSGSSEPRRRCPPGEHGTENQISQRIRVAERYDNALTGEAKPLRRRSSPRVSGPRRVHASVGAPRGRRPGRVTKTFVEASSRNTTPTNAASCTPSRLRQPTGLRGPARTSSRTPLRADLVEGSRNRCARRFRRSATESRRSTRCSSPSTSARRTSKRARTDTERGCSRSSPRRCPATASTGASPRRSKPRRRAATHRQPDCPRIQGRTRRLRRVRTVHRYHPAARRRLTRVHYRALGDGRGQRVPRRRRRRTGEHVPAGAANDYMKVYQLALDRPIAITGGMACIPGIVDEFEERLSAELNRDIEVIAADDRTSRRPSAHSGRGASRRDRLGFRQQSATARFWAGLSHLVTAIGREQFESVSVDSEAGRAGRETTTVPLLRRPPTELGTWHTLGYRSLTPKAKSDNRLTDAERAQRLCLSPSLFSLAASENRQLSLLIVAVYHPSCDVLPLSGCYSLSPPRPTMVDDIYIA